MCCSTFLSYRTLLLILVAMTMAFPERAKGAHSLRYVEGYFDGDGGLNGLEGTYSAVISGDGKFVYVGGAFDHSIMVFSRDLSTGVLSFIDSVNEGEDGIISLDPRAMALSPDGKHLYAGGCFSRDPVTGLLTRVEFGSGNFGISFAISPDGKHIYGVGQGGDVYVSSRDASTGATAPVETFTHIVNGNTFYTGTVALSPDGKNVYVGGLLLNDPNHIDATGVIAVFARDAATGKLTFVQAQIEGQGGVFGLDDVKSIAFSPDGSHVYAASRIPGPCITLFSRNSTTGALTFVEAVANGGPQSFGSGVVVSPDGTHVYTTNDNASGTGGGAVSSFARNPSTGRLTLIEAEVDDANGVHGMGGPLAPIISPDGKNLYIPALSDKAIAFLSCDVATGMMTFLGSINDGMGGLDTIDSLGGIAISPDGRNVYTTSAEDDAISVFARDEATGELQFIEAHENGVNGVHGMIWPSYGLAVSPDGAYVYVSAILSDTIVIFSRNPASGALTFLTSMSTGLSGGPTNLDISPDGSTLYAKHDGYGVFTRNIGTGALSLVQSDLYPNTGDAIDIGLSPDGAFAYVGITLQKPSGWEAGIALNSRHSSTGALTYIKKYDPPRNNPFIFSFDFAPDGRQLYASTGSILIYERNTVTGELTQIQEIASANRVLVSPQGDFVLGLGEEVFLFERNEADGKLSFSASLEETEERDIGVSYPSTAALSPDGRHVYVRADNGKDDGFVVVAIDGVNSAEDWVMYP